MIINAMLVGVRKNSEHYRNGGRGETRAWKHARMSARKSNGLVTRATGQCVSFCLLIKYSTRANAPLYIYVTHFTRARPYGISANHVAV